MFQLSLFILIEAMTESIQQMLLISDELVNKIYRDFLGERSPWRGFAGFEWGI